jgi:hypothetical protein
LKSFIVVSNRAIDASVQEIKAWARAPWAAGIHPNLEEGMPIDHPSLEPIWAAANDAGLCVTHHSFTAGYPGYGDLWDNPFIGRTASHPWGAMRAVSLFSAPASWIATPTFAIRLDPARLVVLAARMTIKASTTPSKNRRRKPSEYMTKGRFFARSSFTKAKDGKMVELLGDGVLIIHPTTPTPNRFLDPPTRCCSGKPSATTSCEK